MGRRLKARERNVGRGEINMQEAYTFYTSEQLGHHRAWSRRVFLHQV